MLVLLRVFDNCVVLSPDTGYLALEEREVDSWEFVVDFGFFGVTKAFVCLSKERSLQSADMSGKSKFLLFSRNIVMSIACFCAAVKLLGAMILFDSGQITCDNFKSSGFDVEELDDVVVIVEVFEDSTLPLTELFSCVFELDEEVEDLRVDGFAGTRS